MKKLSVVLSTLVLFCAGCQAHATGSDAWKLKGKTLDFFPRGQALKQSKGAAYCETPVPAMLETLDCIEREDAECAFEGYAQGFTKLHNGVDTETEISGSFFWSAAFNFLDFKLDYDHVKRVVYDLISTVPSAPSVLWSLIASWLR